MNIKQIPQFFSEVKQQMRQVVWPTFSETRITTLIVFILALVFAMYFFFVDFCIFHVLQFLMNL